MQTERQALWRSTHLLTEDKKDLARIVLEEIRRGRDVTKTLRSHPLREGGYLNKSMLVAIYNEMVAAGEIHEDVRLLERIRMKPMRTLSGVTTVTVLTKPYPCPGKCIFCPTDVRMPKSYLPDEPGAMRGLEHEFDPYAQVRSRIEQLESVGHPTDKIELLILGGTWSSYRRDYQEWFIKRCFDAMNNRHSALTSYPKGSGAAAIAEAQSKRIADVQRAVPGENVEKGNINLRELSGSVANLN